MSESRTLTGLGPMIRLDLANLASWRRVGPILLVALGVMAWGGGMQMAALMLYLGGYLITVNAFTMDDNHRLPLLYGGLPVGRSAVITSHYLIGLAALAGAAVLVVPTALLSATRPRVDFGAELSTGLSIVLVSSTVSAVLIPFIVRFGSKALGYVAVGLFAVLALGMLAVRSLSGPAVTAVVAGWLTTNRGLATAIGIGLLAVAWVASYLVSLRLYEAKDF